MTEELPAPMLPKGIQGVLNVGLQRAAVEL